MMKQKRSKKKAYEYIPTSYQTNNQIIIIEIMTKCSWRTRPFVVV